MFFLIFNFFFPLRTIYKRPLKLRKLIYLFTTTIKPHSWAYKIARLKPVKLCEFPQFCNFIFHILFLIWNLLIFLTKKLRHMLLLFFVFNTLFPYLFGFFSQFFFIHHLSQFVMGVLEFVLSSWPSEEINKHNSPLFCVSFYNWVSENIYFLQWHGFVIKVVELLCNLISIHMNSQSFFFFFLIYLYCNFWMIPSNIEKGKNLVWRYCLGFDYLIHQFFVEKSD